MKFGKSLSEKVRDEWKEYAVNYKAMKRTLPEKDAYTESEKLNEGSPEEAFPDYWDLYRTSQESVTAFYDEKRSWASSEASNLRSRVEKYRLSKAPGSTLTTTDDGDGLRRSITGYQHGVEFAQEFLSINYTAFVKILKKYDKRTLSTVRETKLEEILVSHPFLDGSALQEFIKKCDELSKDVDRIDGIIRRDESLSADDSINAKDKVPIAGSHLRPTTTSTVNITATARNILEKIDKSPFFTKYKARQNPVFIDKEIEKGDILGEGEFSIVREVNAFNVNAICPICMIHALEEPEGMATSESTSQVNNRNREQSNDSSSQCIKVPQNEPTISGDNYKLTISGDQMKNIDMESFQDDHEEQDNDNVANRGFMKHHCFRNGSARYAIKQLKRSLAGTKRADGAIDLSIEAKFLSVLSHSNIIKLCGTGGTPGHPNAFIILDRLYGTLGDRIEVWKMKEREFSGIIKRKKSQLKLLFNDRLLAGFDIARAMKYLHDHDIMYRDLKPENIGFDVRNSAKIFDFGLAKELTDKDKISTDQYKASGRTGTRRYMAPEVVLCKYYGKPADVYSFSILLWEILSLNQPFKGFDYEKHAKTVVVKKKRPAIKKDWPAIIQMTIKEGWDHNPTNRPPFTQICDSLSGQFEDDDGISRTERLRVMETSTHR